MVFSLISHSLTSLISNCLNLLVGPQRRPRRLKVFSYKKEMRSWQGSYTGGLCRVLLGFRRRSKREIFSTDMCNFSYYNFVYGQLIRRFIRSSFSLETFLAPTHFLSLSLGLLYNHLIIFSVTLSDSCFIGY